mmetsp:Transcript_14779/g.21112  ORF Transcript_14779/g.21112 Transcript_14779/m.21112 type:complete len:357 (+) Transcript_14779:55-1125(+)
MGVVSGAGKAALLAGVLGFIAAGLLASTITLGVLYDRVKGESNAQKHLLGSKPSTSVVGTNNPCADAKKKLDLKNTQCIVDAVENNSGPQAGADVSVGYKGLMEVDTDPNTDSYFKQKLCPVNVHWHLGAEHRSNGEFDENGSGPTDIKHRRKLAGKIREGMLCHHYNKEQDMYTKEYDWKYCKDMEVGQTYEVHWPHSTLGQCGSPWQYQTPFYDGVLCNFNSDVAAGLEDETIKLPDHVGVQGQIFTVVNDESYYFPNLINGMIVDGVMGKDITSYYGSTTGTSRTNEICSNYSPITWKVDRKCHLISASSFDKMCADMMSMAADMTDDLHPHGSRELVADKLSANNQVGNLRE